MMKLSAKTSMVEGIPVLWLSGELDPATQAELDVMIAQFAQAGDHLILDVRDVGYADSTSLAAIIHLHRRVSRRGGVLAIVCRHEGMGRVFRMTRLVGVLNLLDDLDAAAQFVSAAGARAFVGHGVA